MASLLAQKSTVGRMRGDRTLSFSTLHGDLFAMNQHCQQLRAGSPLVLVKTKLANGIANSIQGSSTHG